MKKTTAALSIAALLLLALAGCEKKDEFSSAAINDYLNLEVGKYIRYRLDSTLYINFGQKDTVVKYQAKDVVEEAITDGAGRPSWRVVRYLSDSNGLGPWVPTATFLVTPTRESLELVENNLRYLKLKLPITPGYNWKGNSGIDTYSSSSEVRYLDDWDYTYYDIGSSFPVWNNNLVDNTLTVEQRDEIVGFPSDPAAYSESTFSKEVYGLGIGLVYKEFLHWEYQPPNNPNPGYKIGYGIKLVMIDHN